MKWVKNYWTEDFMEDLEPHRPEIKRQISAHIEALVRADPVVMLHIEGFPDMNLTLDNFRHEVNDLDLNLT